MNELYHYGVKGMKWGVHRARRDAGYNAKQRYRAEYMKGESGLGKVYSKLTGADKTYADMMYKMNEGRRTKSKSTSSKTKSAPSKTAVAPKQTVSNKTAVVPKQNTPSKTTAPKPNASTKTGTSAKKSATKKTNKSKEEIDRYIKALEDQEKAQKASFVTSAAGLALRSSGNSYAASFLESAGNSYVSALSINSAYNYWR